jgi:GNAT superfamily N-acetyltransferase
MSSSNIAIRVAEESDGSAVSKIWVDGLSQTVEHSWWIFQPLLRWVFDKAAEKALSEEGDLGPNGTTLIQNWVEPPDRTFLVAVMDDGAVVGCVGVKKKSPKNEHDVREIVTDDTKVAAIYRLSVDASARRKGVARTLMERAHEWAKEEQGCESMWLNSANPRGLDFYKAIGYEPCHWTGFQMSKDL